jgi:uncharacterized RDD family membrane protein YckC
MDAQTYEDTCPICGSGDQMGEKAQILYGHLVCKKCYYGFANRRQAAWIVDVIAFRMVCTMVGFIVGVGTGAVGGSVAQAQDAALLFFLPMLAIFAMKDGMWGYSPGKALAGVQVVDATTGDPIGPMKSFKRNLITILPIVPLFIGYHLCHGHREGDGWANTRVIWKEHADNPVFAGVGMQDVPISAPVVC